MYNLMVIRQIRINGRPQGPGVPAALFSPEALDSLYSFGTLQRGETIEIDVEGLDVLHIARVDYDLSTMLSLRCKRFWRRLRFSAVMIGSVT